MTVADLIEQLRNYAPDTPVLVVVEDEFDSSQPVDIAVVQRRCPLDRSGPYIELVGSL
ncbi:MAG TPA: hypothetical protein VHX39_06265 [Acetobacteraceae bacterium]|jgi:hypothetical protein|nr:hypothetical protein [Acetobacteraceae bacterium]